MGVYIDMEMPVTCCHCPLMGYDPDIEWVDGGRETQGAYICVITHELIDNMKREKHCPLVPVPSHGDLIDRDAAKESIKPWSPEDERSACTFDTVKKLMHTLLNRAPTIIQAEPAEEGE